MTSLRIFEAEEVCRSLKYAELIPAVRAAMIALSSGKVAQEIRSFLPVKQGHIFAMMPAVDAASGYFGSKLISVFPDEAGVVQHSGYVMLFRADSGRPVCLADAEEVTRLRTAAASAVATDALARTDASVLAILGCGKQASAHVDALAQVRPLSEVRIWGRSPEKTERFAHDVAARYAFSVVAARGPQEAVTGADIVCTVTGASEPVLFANWLSPGTHVNAVGSSTPGPAEIDQDLVVRSRFIVDHRPHVLAMGAEFLRAQRAGAVTEDHIAAEIGEVLAGAKPGRTSDDQITVYKSLGHAVQDIAAAAWLYEHA